jgi:hypothetical protein
VRLYLRPEAIGVHVNGAVPEGAYPAKVAKVEFLGAFCLIGIALDGENMPPLTANVPRQLADAANLVAGRAIRVSLPADALRILG